MTLLNAFVCWILVTFQLATVLAAPSGSVPFINHVELVQQGGYPFVVLKPTGSNPPSRPPLNLFLHGTGSVGDASVMDTRLLWNGPGKRINEYYSGTVTTASSMVCEQFLTVMPIHPDDTVEPNVPKWNTSAVKDVLDFVTANYEYDPTRVYLTGYSMGARDGWDLAVSYPTTWTAITVAAGEPTNTSNLRPMLSIPFRHYAGTLDYDRFSTISLAQETQSVIEGLGGKETELVIVQGPDRGDGTAAHELMQDLPWNQDLFGWLLNNTKIDDSITVSSETLPMSTSTSTILNFTTTEPTLTGSIGSDVTSTSTSSSSSSSNTSSSIKFNPSFFFLYTLLLPITFFAYLV